MIPKISGLPELKPVYEQYLKKLQLTGFTGDIESSHSARLLAATDNSVYQRMPQAVIFPKNETDVSRAMSLRKDERFKKIVVTARGGGTGTNGQSLNSGIVIDFSRYMKSTDSFNPEKREIFVQSGVIKDELNDFLRPYGLFFSPELSTSNRATLGGMISNDAAGQGSLKYGRTSSHIKAIRAVLADGSIVNFGPLSGNELAKKLNQQGLEGDIYRKCYALLKENRDQVEEVFPKLNRFMTGYDLAHAYDPKSGVLNLARLICGAEGTLAVVLGALLDLTKIPDFRELMVVKYENFDSALRHAVALIEAGVFSVETVDSKVLNLAKQDPVWESVKSYIKDVPGREILGVNIVEFNGDKVDEEHQRLVNIFNQTCRQAELGVNGILGAQQVSDPQGIAAVYGMRKKAVGLLGAAAGRKKLVAFTEDTVVPPEHLADYILDFRKLLDSLDVAYGMFGHVDTGLMHVRPALDLTSDEDRRKLVLISNKVVELVNRYKGQMWGEHGRGYRSCFGEVFFGKLYPLARKIKAAFDADNILNPGKICVPFGNEEDKLVSIDSLMRGDLDRKIPLAVRENFAGALSCNGNGQCFNYQTSSLMCPSYRYTKDRSRSPKGYSELMREWLRLVNEKGFNPLTEELEILTATPSPLRFLKRLINTLKDRKDDYSSEHLEKIRTCLSCKSCKSLCPAHVNAADLNSRFLSLYYGRYLRPAMDLITLNAEFMLPVLSKAPRLANAFLSFSPVKFFNRKIFNFVDLPKFTPIPFKKLCALNGFKLLSAEKAAVMKPEILIITDPFTVCYEGEGLIAMAKLMRSLGFTAAFLRPYVNGKLMVIRGDRRRFVRFASKQAARLDRLSRLNITLVGFDPALTICYRDEYTQLLQEKRGNFQVLLPEEWMMQVIKSDKFKNYMKQHSDELGKLSNSSDFNEPYYLFTHCTERALITGSPLMWQQIMASFGLKLIPVPVSCCGMAGLFGHMAQNQQESLSVYKTNWKTELDKRPFDHCLITGFSCRSQVRRMEGKKSVHPLYVIERLVNGYGN